MSIQFALAAMAEAPPQALPPQLEPSDTDLASAILTIFSAHRNSDMGVKALKQHLEEFSPHWNVNCKRLRVVLEEFRLRRSPLTTVEGEDMLGHKNDDDMSTLPKKAMATKPVGPKTEVKFGVAELVKELCIPLSEMDLAEVSVPLSGPVSEIFRRLAEHLSMVDAPISLLDPVNDKPHVQDRFFSRMRGPTPGNRTSSTGDGERQLSGEGGSASSAERITDPEHGDRVCVLKPIRIDSDHHVADSHDEHQFSAEDEARFQESVRLTFEKIRHEDPQPLFIPNDGLRRVDYWDDCLPQLHATMTLRPFRTGPGLPECELRRDAKIVFDSGAYLSLIREECLSREMLEEARHPSNLLRGHRGICATAKIRFSNATICVRFPIRVMATKNMPGQGMDVLLGNWGFLDGLEYECCPDEILHHRYGYEYDDLTWGRIVAKSWFQAGPDVVYKYDHTDLVEVTGEE